MTLKLYHYTGEDNRVDKTSLLGTAITVTGDHYEGNQNILAPSVIISSATMPTYNYAYITEYGRYYFIDPPVWIADSLWRLNLRADPLYSHKTAIGNQSGVIQYSASGSPRKYDPRLVYNEAPVVTRVTPSSTGYNPGEAWVIMRVMYFDDNGLHTSHGSVPNTNMRYYVFDRDAYLAFNQLYGVYADNPNNEDKAVAIGKTIVDLSLVYYFTFAGFTQTTDVNFNTPEINQLIGGGSAGGISFTVTTGHIFRLEYSDIIRPYTISWHVQPANYAERKAQRTCYIPFVGSMSIDLDMLGHGLDNNLYVGVQLRYDLGSNAYIMVPGIALPSGSPNIFTTLFETGIQRVANMFTFPFVIDGSYQNADAAMTQQSVGIISNLLGGAVSAAVSGGATIPASAVSLGMGIANMGLAAERIEYQQASSLVMRGSTNGGSVDMAFANWQGSPETLIYPGAFMEVRTNDAAPNYTTYQLNYGYPDGEYRTLNSLSGYVQVAEIRLNNMPNATREEREQITAALKSGVIM